MATPSDTWNDIRSDLRARKLARRELERLAVELGSDHQRKRFHAGVLPESEILALARGELYTPFLMARDPFRNAPIERWHTRVARDAMGEAFRHRDGCRHRARWWRPSHFEVTEIDELDHREWDNLEQLQAALATANEHPWIVAEGTPAVLETLQHWLTCPVCDNENRRSVAKVTIQWAGYIFVREYAL